MKPVTCWEGANGNLKRSQKDAAIDIIAAAGNGAVQRVVDNKEGEDQLRDAILWVAAQIKKRRKPSKKDR